MYIQIKTNLFWTYKKIDQWINLKYAKKNKQVLWCYDVYFL